MTKTSFWDKLFLVIVTVFVTTTFFVVQEFIEIASHEVDYTIIVYTDNNPQLTKYYTGIGNISIESDKIQYTDEIGERHTIFLADNQDIVITEGEFPSKD